MTTKTIALVTLVTAVVISAKSALAGGSSYGGGAYGGGGCVPVYGGGTQCPRPGQVMLDKKVKNPATGIYVDNLSPNDPKYRAQQIVSYQITVKNPGDETMGTISVTDRIPDFVDYMSGPGNYDAKTRVVSWTVDGLAGGASKVYEVKVRIAHPAKFPGDKTVVCPVNVVEAKSADQIDRDESQMCVMRDMEVPQVPTAGPEMMVIPGLASLMGTGLYLRRKISR